MNPEVESVTPFLIDLACAFETSAGWAYGPWEFWQSDCALTFCGVDVSPCGWNEMERLAAGDPDSERWLGSLREDVERRLATRAETGSIFEPRR